MSCIYCGYKTKVNNSRSSVKHHTTWRRRQCLHCSAIYTTREYPELDTSLRLRVTPNSLEPFLRDKLFLSVYFSLSHRKTAVSDAIALTDTIISQTLAHKSAIIDRQNLIDTVLITLKRFDSAALAYYSARHK